VVLSLRSLHLSCLPNATFFLFDKEIERKKILKYERKKEKRKIHEDRRGRERKWQKIKKKN